MVVDPHRQARPGAQQLGGTGIHQRDDQDRGEGSQRRGRQAVKQDARQRNRGHDRRHEAPAVTQQQGEAQSGRRIPRRDAECDGLAGRLDQADPVERDVAGDIGVDNDGPMHRGVREAGHAPYSPGVLRTFSAASRGSPMGTSSTIRRKTHGSGARRKRIRHRGLATPVTVAQVAAAAGRAPVRQQASAAPARSQSPRWKTRSWTAAITAKASSAMIRNSRAGSRTPA